MDLCYVHTYVGYENGCGTPTLIHLTYVRTYVRTYAPVTKYFELIKYVL